MFGGLEFDLLPAVRPDGEQQTAFRRVKRPKKSAWLAGELILRGERLGLERLPLALWHKTTAQQLILTGNALRALPPDIGRLRDLRQLLAGSNRLEALPDELCGLSKLERLELQDNRLEAVPAGIARISTLRLVNLDGNPLGGRLIDGGPTLLKVWLGREGEQGRDGSGSDGAAGDDCDGADGADNADPGGQPKQQQKQQQQKQQQQKQGRRQQLNAAEPPESRTARLLQYLLALQPPADALAVRQAQLAALQAEARGRLEQLLRVPDPKGLEACAAIARDAGLGRADVARAEAARAAAVRLEAAAAAGSREELEAALRGFEDLCKPGRPSGPLYEEAALKLRMLVRADLSHGWRRLLPMEELHSSSPHRPGGGGGSSGDGGSAEAGPQADIGAAALPCAEHVLAHRVFFTPQELRRRQLQAIGAQTFDAWVEAKREAEQRRRREKEEAAQAARRQRCQAAAARADHAVLLCEREAAWPSPIVQPYPRGTFGG